MILKSLRAKIIFIVFTFIIVKGSIFYIYTIYTKNNYEILRLYNIEENVRYETEIVNKMISQIERSAVIYALGGLLSNEQQLDEFAQEFSSEYLLSFPSAIGGGFWFEPYEYREDQYRAGFYAFYDEKTGTVRLDDTFNMDFYDYHTSNWYREIIENVRQPYQVVWTRPYIDDSGSYKLMTTAGSGVFNRDGKLIGISTIDWEIERVLAELSSIKPTENSYIVICVPEKDYIISSTYRESDAGASISILPWDITSDSFILNGKKYLRFGKYMDNGWLMSIQIPENEIITDLEKNNRIFSFVILISAALMLLFAFLIVSKYVNNPIKKLTSEVSKIALNNLDMELDISSDDELGNFSKVLKKMTSDLRDSIEENIRERREKEKLSIELNVAMNIQTSILPNVFPAFPERNEFDIYASMDAAKEVGGDLYDFFFIDKDNLALVIADVSGKGIPAAMFMVITKTLIKNCSFCKSPKHLMESVNKKLCENNDASIFVTAFIGFYNIPTGRFVFVNAGHNPPLLKRKGKDFEFLETKPCLVLAFLKDTKYKEEEIFLEDGDMICMYTDGVTEAMTANREMFGDERLLETVNRDKDISPEELLHNVKKEVNSFTDGAEQTDDITMLAFRVGEPLASKTPELIECSTENELRIDAEKERLYIVTAFINLELEKCKFPQDYINEIDIAVEEIFTNIAEYAYKPGKGETLITISIGEEIVIRFEDTGKPYNPLEHSDPDLSSIPEERKIGGLGIFMVKKLMDSVKYFRKDNKNILVMSRKPPVL